MSNKEKLQKFVTDNNLDFPTGGRNINIVVLCGYALYIGADIEDCKNAIPEGELEPEVAIELERIFEYAKFKNYGKWWESQTNRSEYKVDELI